jgi:uncharacterized membrane protein
VDVDPAVDTADPDERFHRSFFWVVGGLLVAVLWIRPIASSLWIDEFGTWWVIKDGVRQTIDRSWTYQGQSPAYYLLAWVTRHVIGHLEWALRAPSVIFTAISAYLLYRLLKRLVDLECARIATIVFVAWPIVAFSAIDFRPYALATLTVIAATLAFVRWLDDDNPWVGVAYVVFLAASFYAHYLFGLIVIPHVAYAIARTRDGSMRVRTRSLVAAAVGTIGLIAPLVTQMAALWDRRESVALPNGVTVDWVMTLLAPAALVAGLLLGGALAVLDGGRLGARLQIASSDLVLLVTWALGPLLVIVAAVLVTPLGLQARYSLVWAPGAAALAAVAIRSFEPATGRRIIVLALAVLSILAVGGVDHLGDWRGALDTVRGSADERSVVLLQSEFVESLQLDWFADPERRSYLGAPASFYPVPGQPVILPVDVSPDPDFARQEIEAALPGADRVYLVTTSSQLATWVDEVLQGEGGWVQLQIESDDPLVYEYAPGDLA